MKYLFYLFVFLFSFLKADAQSIINQGSPTSLVKNKGGLQVDSALILSPGDTVSWFGMKPDIKRKASNGKLYFFDGTSYKEIGSSSPELNTIYTGNGIINNDRSVNGGSHTITFDSTNSFIINGVNGENYVFHQYGLTFTLPAGDQFDFHPNGLNLNTPSGAGLSINGADAYMHATGATEIHINPSDFHATIDADGLTKLSYNFQGQLSLEYNGVQMLNFYPGSGLSISNEDNTGIASLRSDALTTARDYYFPDRSASGFADTLALISDVKNIGNSDLSITPGTTIRQLNGNGSAMVIDSMAGGIIIGSNSYLNMLTNPAWSGGGFISEKLEIDPNFFWNTLMRAGRTQLQIGESNTSPKSFLLLQRVDTISGGTLHQVSFNLDSIPIGDTKLIWPQKDGKIALLSDIHDSINSHPNLSTNLALGTSTATTQPVTNSNGTGFTLPAATTSTAGLMAAADKTKLNSAITVETDPVYTADKPNIIYGQNTTGSTQIGPAGDAFTLNKSGFYYNLGSNQINGSNSFIINSQYSGIGQDYKLQIGANINTAQNAVFFNRTINGVNSGWTQLANYADITALSLQSITTVGNITTNPVGIGGNPALATFNASSNFFPGYTPNFGVLTGTTSGTYQEGLTIRHNATDATAVHRETGLIIKLSNEGNGTESGKLGALTMSSDAAFANNPMMNFYVGPNTPRMTLSNTSNLGIGVGATTAAYKLQVSNGTTTGSSVIASFEQNGGSLQVQNNTDTANNFSPMLVGVPAGTAAITGASLTLKGRADSPSASVLIEAANAAGANPITGGNILKVRNWATDYLTLDYQGNLQLNVLSGTGIRMVVADASGNITTQAIPTRIDSSIYKFNGGLTSDRILTGNAHDLTFNGLNNFNTTYTGLYSITSSGGGPITLTALSGIKLKSTNTTGQIADTFKYGITIDSAGFIYAQAPTIINTSFTSAATSSILNSTYATVPVKTIVYAINITGGAMMYIKVTSTNWVATPLTSI